MEMEIVRFVLGYIARHGDVNESRQAIQYVESLKQFDAPPTASEAVQVFEAAAERAKESADA